MSMTRRQEDTLTRELARTPCPTCGAKGALLVARTAGTPRWDAASCTTCYASVPCRFDVVARERRTIVWDVTITTDRPDDTGVHVDLSGVEAPEEDQS